MGEKKQECNLSCGWIAESAFPIDIFTQMR